MRRRGLILSVFVSWVAFVTGPLPTADGPLPKLAAFRIDATPPAGEPLIWAEPLRAVEDPLWLKGLVIEEGTERFVLATLDWCELSNDSDLEFRESLGAAAGTSADRVAIQCVHQHAAPYADLGAHRYLDLAPQPPARLSDRFLADLLARAAESVRSAVLRLEPFDSVGTGRARVDRVASTRRIRGEDGRIIVRFSGGAKDPALAALPEGAIDPWLRTITLASGGRPLVRIHVYATHPQTFCCDGRASSDFVGAAREALEKREGVPQLYVTGCAGDVTAGKYNDGSPAARTALRDRLLAAMEASVKESRFEPVGRVSWKVEPLRLPLRTDPGFRPEDLRAKIADVAAAIGTRVYSGAMALSFTARQERPLRVSCLRLGPARLVCLPGEPMLAFQEHALAQAKGRFVAVGGYFDCGPGYICTDASYGEGGYEPTASNVGPGSEAILRKVIERVLEDGP